MKVFIAWAGDDSQNVAIALRKWIKDVLPNVKTWTSHKTTIGADWHRKIHEHITEARAGILCVTRAGLKSDWLLFEAGAIWAVMGAPLCYVIDRDITPDDFPDPLRRFQAAAADKRGTRKLLKSLNQRRKKHKLKNKELKRRFDKRWPELERQLNRR
jgi:hypothetical protein